MDGLQSRSTMVGVCALPVLRKQKCMHQCARGERAPGIRVSHTTPRCATSIIEVAPLVTRSILVKK